MAALSYPPWKGILLRRRIKALGRVGNRRNVPPTQTALSQPIQTPSGPVASLGGSESPINRSCSSLLALWRLLAGWRWGLPLPWLLPCLPKKRSCSSLLALWRLLAGWRWGLLLPWPFFSWEGLLLFSPCGVQGAQAPWWGFGGEAPNSMLFGCAVGTHFWVREKKISRFFSRTRIKKGLKKD